MKRRDFIKNTSAAGLFTIVTPSGIFRSFENKSDSSLESIFINPSNSAKPGNMWFWMNGHVTKEGITLDLEAMERVGIGAVFNFDAGTGIPQGPLKYLSAEWYDMKAHALKECERLGIDFCMHNCPGWSSSGGPWITAELSMKTLTWSETNVPGGKIDNVALALPSTKLNFYRDIVVLAFPSFPPNTPPFNEWKKKTNQEFNQNGTEPIESTTNVIDPAGIINISKLVNNDGMLNGEIPPGNWTILRIGFTSLGTLNRSAPDTGIGLECDKYDAAAIAFHFNKMFANLLPMVEPLAKNGKMGLEIDSFEVGMQNWTDGFENEFERRNGYSLINFLPAMTGRVVRDADTTERFLWDLRRTQADLLADNYYGKFNELSNKHGITTYFEPYDRGPMEELQIGARADSVMGEYWNGLSTIFQNNLTMRRTCKLVSSIAHINGQKIVGVEGLTGEPDSAKWQEYGFAMKPICDNIFTMGINRIIIHRNAHQPHPTAAPGMTMGPWGIQFDRTNTLWEVIKAWLSYLSRCQGLLQQGIFVADLAYFTGEDAGVYTKVNPDDLNPSPLEGYDYDVINAEILIRKAKIEHNRMVLPGGMSYRVLVLQQYKTISLELLKTVKTFVEQGLVMIGAKPLSTPGLKTNNPEAISEFNTIVQQLWGNNTGLVDNKVGNGRVFWGLPLKQVLQTINLEPDFVVSSLSGDAPIKYIHRFVNGDDCYFVCNQRRSFEKLVCSFRINNKKPELWDANTGKMVDAIVYEEKDGKTNVAFHLHPYGSVFLVFRQGRNTNTNSILSISKNNTLVTGSQPFIGIQRPRFNEVINNFSIAFWAKPEMNIMLTTEAFYDGVKDPWTDFYAIYPDAGEKIYGKGHATSGVTVGRNGVAIWENAIGIPVFNSAAIADISGWSYITIVYNGGVPYIYINGEFVQKGDRKTEFIHPATGKTYLKEGASFYNGDMTTPTLFKETLGVGKIQELAKQILPKALVPDFVVEPMNAEKTSFLFWQNGNYRVNKKNNQKSSVEISNITGPNILDGPWEVSFPPNLGAPGKVILPGLISLKDHRDPGVKYFSGTCTYKRDFTVQVSPKFVGKRIFMDLGRVEVVAEVIVNSKNLGIYWLRPYLIDITEAVVEGINKVEINVTNQWVNRLIGDEQQPEADKYSITGEGTVFAPLSVGAIVDLPEWFKTGNAKPVNGRVAFSTWKHFKKESPLLESGLIGPVIIREAVIKEI